MSARLRRAILVLPLGLLCLAASAFPADIYLQIQRGERATVGLPAFVAKGADAERQMALELHAVAKEDLLFARLFNLIESGPAVGEGKIDFAGWGANGADILVLASVSLKEDGQKKGEGGAQMIASVFESPSGRVVFQKQYRTTRRNARRLAHEFVADFLYRFTGNRGLPQSKIAFSNDATGSKELYVIDYDGHNLRRLTSDRSMALLPRWSPDGKELLYTTYADGNPDLAVYSLEEGATRFLSRRRGLNSAAAFSPDGKTVVLTLSHQGAPNLYLLDRKGGILRRLTKAKAADTSASFSADGRKIVFVSDRPGWPQIYMMDSDGTRLERLTESGYCDAPVWSPLGDKIAYSRGSDRGRHDIVLYDVATAQAVQLTRDAGNNENPSFSPDGRFIVCTTTRDRKRELYILSIDGSVQKKLADIPGNSYTPSWGP